MDAKLMKVAMIANSQRKNANRVTKMFALIPKTTKDLPLDKSFVLLG
jgi:hypothetical protein